MAGPVGPVSGQLCDAASASNWKKGAQCTCFCSLQALLCMPLRILAVGQHRDWKYQTWIDIAASALAVHHLISDMSPEFALPASSWHDSVCCGLASSSCCQAAPVQHWYPGQISLFTWHIHTRMTDSLAKALTRPVKQAQQDQCAQASNAVSCIGALHQPELEIFPSRADGHCGLHTSAFAVLDLLDGC